MNRMLIAILISLLCFAQTSQADVSIEISSLKKKIIRVAYTFENETSGLASQIYPDTGFTFANGPINVVSVTQLETEQELSHKIVKIPAEKGQFYQAVKIDFQNPIPQGGSIGLKVVVEAPTDSINIDREGNVSFTYKTSHNAIFTLPEGHGIIYSNFPVFIYERKGRTVVKIIDIEESTDLKSILIKTKPMDPSFKDISALPY